MSNPSTLTDFVFTADFSDSDLLRYADQGVIVNLEDYIDNNMPNLKKVFEMYPEYRTMCTDSEGHIWALPWIEQLGAEKTAIQTVGNMSFINKKWLDFLGLEMPTTVDEFEQVLIASVTTRMPSRVSLALRVISSRCPALSTTVTRTPVS